MDSHFGETSKYNILTSSILSVLTIAFIALFLTKKYKWSFVLVIAAMLITNIFISQTIRPANRNISSEKSICKKIKDNLNADVKWAAYKCFSESFPLYIENYPIVKVGCIPCTVFFH